ncbi:GyrI-like domain-containing protein [Chitinophaga sp. B61]|uniref:GyrI-like domain-containing protein n=2 Tax=Chitinophaga rhizophila TaxID=2866212 RepID=A0ABS7GDG7_9BACT|nr:GyrI-like domain-containing protein [Chitinophaga rhizophila]
MSKTDLTKVHKELYTAKAQPALIFVPAGHYVAITGKGDPNGQLFADSTQALYTAAYTIKQAYKQLEQDFVVSKLEGTWWVEQEGYPLDVPREEWCWQLLIRMPDYVMRTIVQQSLDAAFTRKQLPLLRQVSLITLAEGKSVQILHNGPYSEEPATLKVMEAFITGQGLTYNGRHHEIYLSDPRKTAPARMKTILRQPVK